MSCEEEGEEGGRKGGESGKGREGKRWAGRRGRGRGMAMDKGCHVVHVATCGYMWLHAATCMDYRLHKH